VNVLSEEAGFIDRGGDRTIVLDPIDGNPQRAPRWPAYCGVDGDRPSHLADIEEGLVREPRLGATYYAAKDRGEAQRPIDSRSSIRSKDLLFTVYLGSNAHPDSDRVARLARRSPEPRRGIVGPVLGARGAADLYYMHSGVVDTKLRAVDIAAGTLIVREAGGLVLDMNGRI